MSQSLARNVVHLVFSTKNRRPLIRPEVRDRLFAYLAGTLNEMNCPAIKVGGVEDHVHLLFVLSKTLAMWDVVKDVKKGSSIWAKEHVNPDFYWQTGYAAFSVSRSNEERVTEYIVGQQEHHKKRTFQDEFRAFLRKHDIEWDERYVWD
ncbi:transposase : Transposase OS=Pedosphaera parvula (strain Ellin514) GN=Cflav_PD3019 PE=4 SV=1: Y1_Tnp [Gemmataceae bacterium]|nr:transposase : Transposase OS=Pedosphaera parvula (strain Ellin514) GN=Cflav_PD3019 PE=4 SV=1: Y1_Tnp [Gemmataceae bacterium]VTT97175.1 transposase : Transposase OS=Pedosphaera parvula (strain Ellin514) GN=Cflav_PD3019 PE=4 SV=1: Y1_Tnp [Gemmataceae bacterium]